MFNCSEEDNTSFLTGSFTNSLKTAVVKSNLDNTILSNHIPISNLFTVLPFKGKLIEKVAYEPFLFVILFHATRESILYLCSEVN